MRGYSLMQGLYKVEREDTFDRDGFYHTGDAGYFDADGVLFFKARLGEMIKTAGANVTPREVEVVIESYPEVRAAFVVGVPDPERGQDVAAAVVLKRGAALDAEARARGCARSSRPTRCRASGSSRRRGAAVHRQRKDRQEEARRDADRALRIATIVRANNDPTHESGFAAGPGSGRRVDPAPRTPAPRTPGRGGS